MVGDSDKQRLSDGGDDQGVDDCEVSVILPCLDEAETVGTCVGKAVGELRRLGLHGEVIVVDNGSTDGSPRLPNAAAPGWFTSLGVVTGAP